MMDLNSALNYLRPQINRILTIAPDKRTHQEAALLEVVLRASICDFKATHQHVKRGGFYEKFAEGTLQSGQVVGDETPLTLYRDEGGKVWARPTREFTDGRFVAL